MDWPNLALKELKLYLFISNFLFIISFVCCLFFLLNFAFSLLSIYIHLPSKKMLTACVLNQDLFPDLLGFTFLVTSWLYLGFLFSFYVFLFLGDCLLIFWTFFLGCMYWFLYIFEDYLLNKIYREYSFYLWLYFECQRDLQRKCNHDSG